MSDEIINSYASLVAHITKLTDDFNQHKYLRVSVKTGRQRTNTQNRALHLYLTNVADSLNSAGLDLRKTIKNDLDIPWTTELVKDNIWRIIQKASTGHDSTTKPLTSDYSTVYEIMNRHLSAKLGVYVAWPTLEHKKDVAA